jgi:glycosyltransferase involved in cell wall biosynthesis
MTPRLSILICHLPKLAHLLKRLMVTLQPQIDEVSKYSTGKSVEILIDEHPTESIGTKRNKLLKAAKGKYVCFIDDDDFVSDNYIPLLFEGINQDYDCCSLTGEITEDGKNPLIFQHSIRYKEYKTNTPDKPVRYERYPNHLNAIRSSIAKQFKFPEKNHGEDTDWAAQIFKSGLIKTEHWIEDVIYMYDFRSKK